MALGWPVMENGPMPGLPMRPVARWQLMMLLTLSVPADDWFTPIEKPVTTFAWRQRFVEGQQVLQIDLADARHRGGSAQSASATASASSKPLVWAR
jgi:hypothetical protein